MSAAVLDDGLVYEILSVVAEIPEGRVASYGQIAALIGRERNARLVGKVLSRAELYGDYPCHRVVNHAGRLAPHWPEQRALLEAEGVAMKDAAHVDMKRFRWAPESIKMAGRNREERSCGDQSVFYQWRHKRRYCVHA